MEREGGDKSGQTTDYQLLAFWEESQYRTGFNLQSREILPTFKKNPFDATKALRRY